MQPPQVAAIVEEDRELRQLQNDRALRIIEEGLRSRQQLGTFLPPARFDEIHRQRHHLVVDDEMVRFPRPVRVARRHPGYRRGGVLASPRQVSDDGMDTLLTAAFDTAPDVRERVATLLGAYPNRSSATGSASSRSAIRRRRYARRRSTSLGRMADDELFEQLLQEVRKPNGPYRQQAIEALRVSRGPSRDGASVDRTRAEDRRCVAQGSGGVLAALNTGESVDVLVDIALNDSDWDDREAAATALGSASTEALNRRILSRLEWKRPMVGIVVASVLLAFGLMAAAIIAGLPLVGLILTARTQLILALVALTIVTGVCSADCETAASSGGHRSGFCRCCCSRSPR